MLAKQAGGLAARLKRAVARLRSRSSQSRKETEWIRVVVAAMPQDKLQARRMSFSPALVK